MIIESIRYSVSLKKPSTRWWQLKHFSFSPLPGEDVPIWLYNIFQRGWFNPPTSPSNKEWFGGRFCFLHRLIGLEGDFGRNCCLYPPRKWLTYKLPYNKWHFFWVDDFPNFQFFAGYVSLSDCFPFIVPSIGGNFPKVWGENKIIFGKSILQFGGLVTKSKIARYQ